MINEIKRRLDAGKKVELECMDRDGFVSNEINRTANMLILNQESLIVQVVHEEVERVVLEGVISPVTSNTINFDELKFFKIKEQNFDDLVDKAIKAVRDYVAIITHLELDNITIESINYDLLSPIEIYRKDEFEKIQKAINWVDSLYTETFVIECEEDIKKIRDGAEIVLANNERGTFNTVSGLRSITNKKTGTEVMGLNIFWLKGATVTQKRGK